ncbi:sigma-54 interaction domain-containing protein [Gracilimonas tropica]|uniref:sigma-54 interaction domain-containing protein n=1 Tax=Gracilimonas tropica TaxID=454600 RepID=UPI00035EBB3F|nr:sigma-54 dependent transcriptional regulator [Gracilimonas tropica]
MKHEIYTGKPIFLTQDDIVKNLLEKVKQVARVGATLLLTGENGTGKEVLARMYHYFSKRNDKPMVAVNCGAIPDELVESELFGHEKGAFTGAYEQKKGCFELADGGTLFLDEIGEMPLNMQVKLLRAVETGTFRRVGGKQEIQVDVNLISATNKILMDQVKSGSFREDLYYRINVIELYVPPLRHRKGDIPLLVNFYSNYFSELYAREGIQFGEDCMNMFMEHDWPGNVRELRNVVERSVVLSEDRLIRSEAVSPWFQKKAKSYNAGGVVADSKFLHIPIGTSLEEIERKVIDQTLNSVDNNKTEAAKILGFTRKTLHNKLDKYGKEMLVTR